VIHTLGTLIEDGHYKQAIKDGNLPGLVGSFVQAVIGGGGNPLEKSVSSVQKGSYEGMNRDAGTFDSRVIPSRLSLTMDAPVSTKHCM
jgi:hypothetical protein